MDIQPKLADFAVRFFDDREVRAVWYEGEWWFSTADAVGAFAGVDDPSSYWSKIKRRLKAEGGDTLPFWQSISMPNRNGSGRKRPIDCSNEQMLLRIVQSMPTARVEHIRQWLAQVGAERLREERNPALGVERAVATHQRRYGMTEMEAAQAVQATAARKQLTGTWKLHGIQQGRDYAILTNVGHEATFDISVRKHKELKDLSSKDNLRPHMTGIELALTMLQENTEQELIRQDNLQGFQSIKNAAQTSGEIAAGARRAIEDRMGRPVVSAFNRKQKALKSA